MSRYRFVAAQRDHYPVRLLCQLVEVPTSGYYVWQQAQQQTMAQRAPVWEAALVKVFGVHKRCYGTRRLQVALRQKGYQVGRQRLRVAMRRWGDYRPCSPRRSPRARPIPHTDCPAPPTAYSTGPNLSKLTGCGSRTSRICPSPTAPGRSGVPSRIWPASSS